MNKFQYAIEKQVCPECGQECAGNAKLEIHMAETHSDKKAAVCEECGKKQAISFEVKAAQAFGRKIDIEFSSNGYH